MIVVPKPQHMEVFDTNLEADSFQVIVDNEEIYEFVKEISTVDGKCEIRYHQEPSLEKEHYKIKVSQSGIDIAYGTPEGAFRAHTTLKQLIDQMEEKRMNCLEIEDFPSFENRGYMLDISRGKLPKMEYIKKLVDILADLKYNQLQLYMDSFVYEYKNFPQYWQDTKVLSRAQIEELDLYCEKRFMRLVPNQNGFGHMGKWLEKEENASLAITGKDGKPSQTLNPLKEESVHLIDQIYEGFLDAFSANMVNIGMDEPFELGLNETKEACEKYGIGKIYTDYLRKICTLAMEKYQKTPMFWDDIVFKFPEQLDNIPKTAVVMEWGYEAEHYFERKCAVLREKGLRYYVCPGSSMWGSYTGRTNNMIMNIATAAECGNYYGAEGFLLTEWGDNGHPQFPAMTYYPLVFAAAVSWNCGSHHSGAAKYERKTLNDACKAYIDRYLYQTRNDVSLADIAYRMGNYYLLEDALDFNGTELSRYIVSGNSPSPRKKRCFQAVKDYMCGLKEELATSEADKLMKRQIEVNCDMVILFADILTGQKDYHEELTRISKEFEELWKMDNRIEGMEIFKDFLASLQPKTGEWRLQ